MNCMHAGNMNERTASCSLCFLVALVVISSVCEGSRSNLMDAATMRSGEGVGSECTVLLEKSSQETAGESASPKGMNGTSGSSLPDCSHACGPCFPCKRVMVSVKGSAESCPMVYRCMCKGRYYHVPSN